MNKQTDKEKETDKLTCNKEDRRIHKKVCICDNKKKHQYLPTTIISTKNPATQITYIKTYTNKKKKTQTQTQTKHRDKERKKHRQRHRGQERQTN